MQVQESNNALLLNKKINELVMGIPGADEVLKIFGIPVMDFESDTLIQVCASLKLNENDVLNSLQKLQQNHKYHLPNKYHSWPVSMLIQFIKQEHHAYTRSLIEDITGYEEKARSVHANQYPKLNQIHWYFQNFKEKMLFHLKFQEEKFFPSTKSFISASVNTDGKVRSMEKQIQLVKKDQEELDHAISKMAELSNNFTPPSNTCTTLQLMYHGLYNLKEDLKVHHFIENEYLISALSKAIEKAKR